MGRLTFVEPKRLNSNVRRQTNRNLARRTGTTPLVDNCKGFALLIQRLLTEAVFTDHRLHFHDPLGTMMTQRISKITNRISPNALMAVALSGLVLAISTGCGSTRCQSVPVIEPTYNHAEAGQKIVHFGGGLGEGVDGVIVSATNEDPLAYELR